MLTEADKLELVHRYGSITKSIAEPLVATLAGLLHEHDIIGLSFVVEAIDGVLKSAVAEAEKIQQARGYYSGTVQ